MRTLLVGLAVSVVVASAAGAEATVVLKTGETLTGQVIESGDRVGVATADGLRMLSRDEIERIEYDAFGRATKKQLARYRATERSASEVAHPAEAVILWRRYLDECSQDNPLSDEAEKQLSRWALARKDGKVVWAGKLMKPEERESQKAQAMTKLAQGAAEYRGGRYRKCVSVLREATRAWPDHPGIHFLMGLAFQKNRNPTEAARHYEEVLNARPGHVPTLNNLGALECVRRRYALGVSLVLEALKLGDDVVVVNDNAFRTLLRVSGAKLRGFEGEIARLRNASARFEAAMLQQGLKRWGTSWITADKYASIEQQNREIAAKVQSLTEEIGAIRREMEVLQGRIAELERQRRSAPSDRDVVSGVDTDGDGVADVFYSRDTVTREQLDLLLADHVARLAASEGAVAGKQAMIPRLLAGRIEPVFELDYILLEELGAEMLSGTPVKTAPVPLAPSYVGPTSVAELVTAIRSGRAILLADDGTFLGKVSREAADAQSILNEEGAFGNPKSPFSLTNPESKYTNKDSDQSVSNPSAKRPPKLFYDGNLLAFVTANEHLTPRVRLQDILAVLRGE